MGMGIKERVESVLREKGWTKVDLAEEMDMEYTTVYRKISGERKREEGFLIKLADTLGVSVGYLLGETVNMQKSRIAEVQVYVLESGVLMPRGQELLPLVALRSESCIIVEANEERYIVDLGAKPRSGEPGLLEIDGYAMIGRVVYQKGSIRVGEDTLPSDAVTIKGRVTHTLLETKPTF